MMFDFYILLSKVNSFGNRTNISMCELCIVFVAFVCFFLKSEDKGAKTLMHSFSASLILRCDHTVSLDIPRWFYSGIQSGKAYIVFLG